jgi:acetolactate synthase-1/2/3 large subunit
MTGWQAAVEALLRCGITSGFGIPSIHNIPLYEGLRLTPEFHHWIVRHEQAAGFAADAFYRRSGRVAVVFASTGPGNLFTLVPLLESLQTNTPVLLIGSNIASSLLSKSRGALHETPLQTDIFRPLTRFARRVSSADEIPEAIAAAAEMLHSPGAGPAFVEIPHDIFHGPITTTPPQPQVRKPAAVSADDLAAANKLLAESRTPAILVGAGIRAHIDEIRHFAEKLQAPVFTTTSGKGLIADDHPLAMGCISRLGVVQEVLSQSDLLISFGALLTEFDTGRFSLGLPARHLRVVDDPGYAGDRYTATVQLVGDIGRVAAALAAGGPARPQPSWCDVAAIRSREKQYLESLHADGYEAVMALRAALDRKDVVVNDQSILNYWASTFFPVMEPGTFIYPYGSGTLGYGLPAAIGTACAMRVTGQHAKVVCISGDGGFQYTQHELATLAQYNLPVKLLLVNDDAYGIIGYLQRSMFGQTHEVELKNPDFCRLAGAHGIQAERVESLDGLRQKLPEWLALPGPAVLEWHTKLKAPWETAAVVRPDGLPRGQHR